MNESAKGTLFSRELRLLAAADTKQQVAACADQIRYVQETIERQWAALEKRVAKLEQEGS